MRVSSNMKIEKEINRCRLAACFARLGWLVGRLVVGCQGLKGLSACSWAALIRAWEGLTLPGVLLLLVVVGGGCNKVEGKNKGDQDIVIPVAVEKASVATIHEEVFLAGDIHAEVEVRVLSLVPERILKLNFEEGDKVEKGQHLATVKAGALYDAVRGARAGLKAAKTQQKLAKIELDRTRKLRKTGTVPVANLQRAEAQYNSAKAQLAQAEAMLSQSHSNISNVTVRAPVSGIIGQKFLNKGDVAGPSVPLCTIVQLDPVRVKATATEFDLVKLKKKQPAVITLPAYPDKKWKGDVDYLSPVLDRATRSALVTIIVENKDHHLRPGMFADVVVKTGQRSGVIAVPARAVRRRVLTGGGVEHFVFLADGDVATMRKVDIGIRKDDRIEIRKGLKTGDPVIVLGNHRLKEGTKIKVQKNPLKKSSSTEKGSASGRTTEGAGESESEGASDSSREGSSKGSGEGSSEGKVEHSGESVGKGAPSADGESGEGVQGEGSQKKTNLSSLSGK